VTRVLERVIGERGVPGAIRCDNGPEFTSLYFVEWCKEKGITVVHIQPGKPVQDGHVESFNGRFRDECLNTNWFVNLADARARSKRANGIQRGTSAQQSGVSDAERVRQNLLGAHQQEGPSRRTARPQWWIAQRCSLTRVR